MFLVSPLGIHGMAARPRRRPKKNMDPHAAAVPASVAVKPSPWVNHGARGGAGGRRSGRRVFEVDFVGLRCSRLCRRKAVSLQTGGGRQQGDSTCSRVRACAQRTLASRVGGRVLPNATWRRRVLLSARGAEG